VQPACELRPLPGDIDQGGPGRASCLGDQIPDDGELGHDRLEYCGRPEGVFGVSLGFEHASQGLHNRLVDKPRMFACPGEPLPDIGVKAAAQDGRNERESSQLPARTQHLVNAACDPARRLLPAAEVPGDQRPVARYLACQGAPADAALGHERGQCLGKTPHRYVHCVDSLLTSRD